VSPQWELSAQDFNLLQPLPQLGKQGPCLARFEHWFKSSMAHHLETLASSAGGGFWDQGSAASKDEVGSAGILFTIVVAVGTHQHVIHEVAVA
jgi:hypothetical protein